MRRLLLRRRRLALPRPGRCLSKPRRGGCGSGRDLRGVDFHQVREEFQGPRQKIMQCNVIGMITYTFTHIYIYVYIY